MMKAVLLLIMPVCYGLSPDFINIWPFPQQHTLGKSLVRLERGNLQFHHNVPPSPAANALETAIQHHKEFIFKQLPYVPYDGWMKQQMQFIEADKERALPILSRLEIRIEYFDVPLDLAQPGSEAYSLNILTGQDQNKKEFVLAELTAFSVWGALHGLWTFTQLVSPFETSEGATAFIAPTITIDDWPR
jgi:hypothetical protein